MAQTFEQLGQLRPANTTAASLYTQSGANIETLVKTIHVCNVTAVDTTFSIFQDANGTTYDETTALYFNVALPANTTVTIEDNIMMNDQSGNLGVRTSTANAINFTANGSEVTS